MTENLSEKWFNWFYTNWEQFSPGELIDNGLLPSQIAERFVNDHHANLMELASIFDDKNKEALEQFIKLSESEFHVMQYFLRLIQLKKIK